eukprot:3456666-Alexandrium_andersonii.AAC.1
MRAGCILRFRTCTVQHAHNNTQRTSGNWGSRQLADSWQHVGCCTAARNNEWTGHSQWRAVAAC